MFSKEAPADDPAYYDDLAAKERAKGNHKKAVVNYRKALEIREASLSEDDMDLICSHYNLGVACKLSGESSQAVEELEKAVQSCNRHHPGETGLISDALSTQAYAYIGMKKYDSAEDCLGRCLKLRKAAKERNPREISAVYEAYTVLCAVSGNKGKRWDYANLRVEEAKKVQPVDEPLIVDALFHRAKAEYNNGLFEQCEITLLEAQARMYSFPAPDKKMEKTISDSLRVINRELRKKNKKGLF